MIVKALESRLVKPVAEHRGWKRIRSMEYLGYGRGYLLVRGWIEGGSSWIIVIIGCNLGSYY